MWKQYQSQSKCITKYQFVQSKIGIFVYLGNSGLKVVGPVIVGAIRSSSIISSVSSSPAYDDDDFVGDWNSEMFSI